MRLGRSYLNYAETMLRLNDANTAIEYINKTRTAHGKLPALPTGLPIEEVWKEYKRERRLELVHESDRYWSLLRWGKADGKDIVEELTKVHQSISISEDGNHSNIFFFHIDQVKMNVYLPKRDTYSPFPKVRGI